MLRRAPTTITLSAVDIEQYEANRQQKIWEAEQQKARAHSSDADDKEKDKEARNQNQNVNREKARKDQERRIMAPALLGPRTTEEIVKRR